MRLNEQSLYSQLLDRLMQLPCLIQLPLDVLEEEQTLEQDLVLHHAGTREHEVDGPIDSQVDGEEIDTAQARTRTMHGVHRAREYTVLTTTEVL